MMLLVFAKDASTTGPSPRGVAALDALTARGLTNAMRATTHHHMLKIALPSSNQ